MEETGILVTLLFKFQTSVCISSCKQEPLFAIIRFRSQFPVEPDHACPTEWRPRQSLFGLYVVFNRGHVLSVYEQNPHEQPSLGIFTTTLKFSLKHRVHELYCKAVSQYNIPYP